MARLFLVLLLSAAVAGAGVAVSAKQLERDAGSSLRERPVQKLVRMLQDMQRELHDELEDDKAVHEMLDCWCDTNEKEKTQSIELGEAKSAQMQSTMDETTAKILETKAKRKATQEEMYRDQKALGQANEQRMKDNKAFHEEETDTLESIDAANQAVVVLSKHHPDLAQLRSVMHFLQQAKVQKLFHSGAAKQQVQALQSFMDQAPSLLQIPGFKSYSSQSGQIFGILKQMSEDFTTDLKQAQAAEAKAKAEYEALKAAKEDEIAAAQKAIAQMDEDLGNFDEKHAQAAQEFEDAQAQLALDREFLATLKKKCAVTDAEFNQRVKTRLEEIDAVEDTIKILNDDTAFDVFDKSVNTAFLQTSEVTSQKERMQRRQAASVLQRAATRTGAAQLAMLAISAQLDAFTKVKAEIDRLVAELTQQTKDEIKHRDWCIDELASNKRETTATDDKKENLVARIAELKKTIETQTSEIDAATTLVAETQKQMKRDSETREAENADAQKTIQDQQLTQLILGKAIARMKEVYALMQMQQPGAPHIQTSGTHTDPGNGPAKFKKYATNAGGSRVVAMLEDVLKDSEALEDEAVSAEEDSQTAYENFMKDSNELIIAKTKAITYLTGARAKAKEELSQAETDLRQTLTFLESLYQTGGDLHKSCDYITKNFDLRQEARTEEIDALNEAKGILSGMK